MRQIEIMQRDHPQAVEYEKFLQQKFSSLKDNRNPIDCHIVLKRDHEWVAGASLIHQDKMENDLDVRDHWDVPDLQNCTRILRLWSLESISLPRLLRAIQDAIPKSHFAYGILSISPRFAKGHADLFRSHLQLVSPKFRIEDVNLVDEDYATSEGQRLIEVYKKFNAQFMGPLAVSPIDQAVRILMGLPMSQVQEPSFWRLSEALP
jgi:hypothetical protein